MSDGDRIKAALRAIIREGDPRRTFVGIYEYRTSSDGASVHADPTDITQGLPSLTDQETRPTPMGEQVTLREGMLILIAFVNGDPRRPFIIGGDSTQTAKTISIDAGDPQDGDALHLGLGSATVLRDGDVVSFAGFGPSPISLPPSIPPARSKVKA